MAFYPVFIEWKDVPCLIAVGGPVALHKAELLCSRGADVTVVALDVCPEMLSLPVRIHLRRVSEEDVIGQSLVVDATGDEETGQLLKETCLASRIPFNSASRSSGGTAVFPAVYQEGRTMLAVSGLGASPAASALLRDILAEHIPTCMDEILDAMAKLRPLSLEYFSGQPMRSLFLHRCLNEMMERRRALGSDEILLIRQSVEKEYRPSTD